MSETFDIWHPPINSPAILSRDGPVATITLNRPRSLNAINVEMAARLAACADAVMAEPDIRVLIVKGQGTAFSAGGDIELFAANIDDLAPPVGALLAHLDRFICAMRFMNPIVITCVHKVAAGAGCSLAFMGDFCIAEEDARFRPSYAALGVCPDAGGTVGIVERLGKQRALKLFLADDELSAREAFEIGLVSFLAARGSLTEEVNRLVRRILGQNVDAVAATKRLVYAREHDIQARLDNERAELLLCMATEKFKCKVRKFGEVHRS